MVITVAPALGGGIDSPSRVRRRTVMRNTIGLPVSIRNRIRILFLFIFLSLRLDSIIRIYWMCMVHVAGTYFAQTNMAASNNFSFILATLAAVLIHDVSPYAM